MHIPDNYLSPQTCAVMAAAMVPVWTVSVRRLRLELSGERDSIAFSEKETITTAKRLPMLGVAAAFSFLGMMFNIPLPGGTTGHAVGGTLLALLVGPYGACVSISAALLLQALLFGDGGILAFGANCFNMAFVMPFVGYGLCRLIWKWSGRRNYAEDSGKSVKSRMAGVILGSYAGINAAALCAAIEFGIQPMLFRDASGAAQYCPYPLSVSIPAMMAGHLTIFGLAEVVYTAAVYLFLARTAPDVLRQYGMLEEDYVVRTAEHDTKPYEDQLAVGSEAALEKAEGFHRKKVWERCGTGILLGLLIILTPLGLLAEGTAWGEWGADEIAATGAGYTPSGMLTGFSFASLLPDYSLGDAPAAVGYILSAVVGVAILLIVFRLLSAGTERSRQER